MRPLAPFEPSPVVAVAVSGGADSMALLHLVAEWAAVNGGHVVAMTVDHRLRSEAAEETKQVAVWAAALGVEHVSLVWDDPKPGLGAIQDRARQARYRLLEDAASKRGILHLAVAHHADDQAETVLMRLAKGSGVDGLAGMAAIVERSHVRLLRPLLPVAKARLAATCAARGQDWIEDPSNVSSHYTRSRLRRMMPALAETGLTASALAETASRMAETRTLLENETAKLLARGVSIYPQGYATLRHHPWQEAAPELRARVLARIVRTIGGEPYAPRGPALDRLLQSMASPDFSAATLGGCVIERRKAEFLICREARALPPPLDLAAGETARWDRFTISATQTIRVNLLDNHEIPDGVGNLPRRVLQSQPACFDGSGLVALPTLFWHRGGDPAAAAARFVPPCPLSPPSFAIVSRGGGIILTPDSLE